MYKTVKIQSFSLLFIVILSVSAPAQLYPTGDLNQDFTVDTEDLLIFVEQWMDESGCTPPNCAELDNINRVTLSDFSLLAANWLEDYGLPLVINEFMASNGSSSGISDPQGEFDDWIEIHNYGETAIDVGGMHLTDNLSSPTAWQFPVDRPAATTIDPNGFLVVWADEDITDTPGLHADFKLSSNGEEIGLFEVDGTTLTDSVTFGDQVSNISYGRWPDGTDDLRFFATATPAAQNNNAYIGLVGDTKFSHNRGFYDASFDLTITCATLGAEIYYTTDGSAPIENEADTSAAILYTGPISIATNTCLRAAAIKTGWMPTNIDTHTYIFDASVEIKAMPIICLTGDTGSTFFEPDGIMAIVGGYYDGNGVWQSDGAGSYNNPIQRGIAFERPVSFELIDQAKGTDIQEDCGIRVHGSDYTRPRYTRGEDWATCYHYEPGRNTNKFGFNLWFRSDYGENRLEYPFFPFTDVDRFKSIVLRQGSDDACTPFVKDEWVRRLFAEMGRTQGTGTFTSLYLNGEYKSYYNPSVRGDEEFYQEWYGTDNTFDVITQSGVRNGDSAAWDSLRSYASSHDLSNRADYEYVAKKFDIPTFIDFMILEIHIGNFDWPGNNWDVHRERSEDGIFRFSVWDAEGMAETWVFGDNGETMYKNAFEHFPTWTSPTGLNNLEWGAIPKLYRALRVNEEFKVLFADRVHKHFRNGGILTEEHLLQRWWEVFGELSPVLPETTNFPVRYVPDTFIPMREPYTLAAFHDNNLFDYNFGYPIFNVNGSYQHGGNITASDTITITESDPSGTLYYTTDGNDPRQAGSTPPAPFLLGDDAAKKAFVPTSDIGTDWRGGSEPYDDSSWTSGTSGVGYESPTSTGYESLIGLDAEAEMYGSSGNSTCYIRIPFTIDGGELASYSNLELRIRYDDGFVAYINGTEVQRVNFSGTPLWNSASSADHGDPAPWDSYNISASIGTLQAGTNILAIHGLNTSTGSSDFLISAELEVSAGTLAADISPSAIEYTSGFNLPQSTELKARILSETGQWSVLNEARYNVGPVAQSLRVNEIMYHPVDPNDEFIELINIGPSAVNLNLVRFTKGVDFTFGTESLDPNERILIVRNQAEFMLQYPTFTGRIAGEYEGRLNDAGDKVRLRDALNTIIQEFTYKDGWYDITDGQGFSLTIRDPYSGDPNDWNLKEGWRPSAAVGGSPGTDDSNVLPDPGSVVINEVLAHSHAAEPDWIELHNTTAQTINIGGWFLSDNNDDDPNIVKYKIPTGTSIPALGYIVFDEDDHFGNPAAEGVNTPFALNEGGDAVYLRSGSGGVIGGYEESESFGASATNVAFGRFVKSILDGGINFVPMSTNTPSAENAYPLVGPVVISEIMYNTEAVNTGGEYIELHNITGSTVTLQDSVSTETSPGIFSSDVVSWKFSDGIDYIFPSGTSIPAKGYLIIAENPTAFTAYYGALPSGANVLGPFQNGTRLSNGGEQVQIVRPGDQEYGRERFWIRTERVKYDDDIPWPLSADGDGDSLNQKTPDVAGANYGNDVINWQAIAPNPGQ
jgi:hypothetical protein